MCDIQGTSSDLKDNLQEWALWEMNMKEINIYFIQAA